MSESERPPLRGVSRVVSLAAITFAIFAGTLFIVIIVLGSGGSRSVAEVFGPVAIGATVLGLITAIWALFGARTRTLGIITLLVLVPCVVLSLLRLVAMASVA
ncbi:hypothetical protein [Glaciihabitans sp. dw_435]|uniref:hypothetical protein n=1 Tax=Glaciihabitans sp. dw_435 TaxID=2720081 RepID=UPI001BD3BAF5|nr:hypothetical protein [Glaciihabitans sp. dw_435]